MSKNDREKRLVKAFKALSNPYRLAIYRKLFDSCKGNSSYYPTRTMKKRVRDLGKGMELAPSTISHHIKELRGASLIHVKKSGKEVYCWINQEMVDEVINFFLKKKKRKVMPQKLDILSYLSKSNISSDEHENKPISKDKKKIDFGDF